MSEKTKTLTTLKYQQPIEKLYINESEAALRYGYSRQWFQRQRWLGTGPTFIKINGGRVLYNLEAIDSWFSGFTLQKSTSMSSTLSVSK